MNKNLLIFNFNCVILFGLRPETEIEKTQILLFFSNTGMICAACETRKHFECIDCMNNHKTYLCSCDCHDENTESHEVGKSH